MFVLLIGSGMLLHAQIQVGTGAISTTDNPIVSCYGYTYSEQIYTAAEIGASGSITSISFYVVSVPTPLDESFDWTINLGHTSKSAYTSSTDWVTSSGMNEAFTGTVTFPAAGNWMTMTLDTPFAYNGTDNLVIGVDENTSGWDCSVSWQASSVANSSIYFRSDSTNPDPATPPTATGRTPNRPNVILGGIQAACPLPSTLTATNITSTSANLGWTENGTATAWDIQWGTAGFDQASEGTLISSTADNPYSLGSLSSATDYEYYVRADCGASDGVSSWAGPFSFTTACAAYAAPFLETVENNSSSLNCWSINDNNNDASTWDRYNDPDFNTIVFGMPPSANSGADDDYLISPQFTATGTEQLKYSYRVFDGASPNDFEVLLSTTGNSPADFSTIILSNTTYSNASFIEAVIDLTSYTGDIYIAFRVVPTGIDGSFVLIDDIIFEDVPNCQAPTALDANNITEASADLSFTELGTATMWDIEYGVDGFAQASADGTIVSATTNPYNLTGLTADTGYDYYVRSNCGGGNGESAWAGPFSFTTSPDYCGGDNFFDNGGAAGNYLTGTTNQTTVISPSSAGHAVTVEFLSFNTEYNYDGLIIYDGPNDSAPLIDSGGTGFSNSNLIDGSWTGTGASSANGEVFRSTHPSGALTFVFIQDSTGVRAGWEATVTCAAPPACLEPTTLTATNITATTADLGWTENNSATAWEVVVQAPGTGEPAGAGTAATTNPYPATGLDPNTDYEFYVRSNCGGSGFSAWAGPFNFTTLPGAHNLPLTEGFESGLTLFDNASGNAVDWAINTAYFHTGTQSVSNAHGSSNENTLVETGIFDLTGSGGAAVLEFWHIAKTEGTYDKGFVEISSDGGATYTSLSSPNATYSGAAGDFTTRGYFHEDSYSLWGTSTQTPDNTTWWKKETFTLVGYTTSNIRLRFRLTSDGSGNRAGWFIDDISVSIPSCPAPNSLIAENITDTTADLSWVDAGSATVWDLEYGTAGFTQSSGTILTGLTNNFRYGISSLAGNTNYEFYVRADCGGDSSDWAGPYAFSTLCAATSDFTEGFEGLTSGALPDCWTSFNTDPNGFTDAVVTSSTLAENAGSLGVRLYNGSLTGIIGSGTTDEGENILISPELSNLGAGTHRLRFFADAGTATSTIEVGTMTDINDPSTFSSLQTVSPTTTHSEFTVNFDSYTGADTYVAIRHIFAGTFDSMYIDDMVWEAIPSCLAPSGLAAGSITTDSASLSWTENNSAAAWEVVVQAPGTGEPAGAGTAVTSNSYTASSLESSTPYEYYVRSNCGGSGFSAWAGPFSFNTSIACGDTVSGLCYSQTSTLEVLASFTASPGKYAEMVFNSGNTENDYDEIVVYDGLNGTGNIIFGSLSPTGGIYNTAGLDPVVSSTGMISLAINSDSGITCSNRSSIDPISITFNCVEPPFIYDGTSWNNAPEGSITSSDDLIVMSGTVVLSSSVSANNVTVMSGATLELANGVMNVSGNLTNDGVINGVSLTIFNGSVAQTISGSGTMARLEVDNGNGVTLNGDQDITTDLRLIDGILTTVGELTMKSTAAGTAFVSNVSSTSGVSGNVTVERFIPAGNRAFRFLGAGTSGQSVFDAWQEAGDNSNGFGMHVTGTSGTVGTNNATTGHDETVSGNSSMFKWDSAAQNWAGVTNTKTEILSAGEFYRILIRGNRSTDLNDNADAATDVTLRSTGTLVTGNQIITGTTGTGTFLAMANPYQSKVNVSLATRSNISDNMYYWDPTLNTQGAYTTIDITSAAAGTNGDATVELEPGQGVFLQETAGASSIMFAEDDKVSGSGNVGILSTPNGSQFLRMKLYQSNQLQAGGNSIDGLIMKFNSSENMGYDFNDAIKFTNIDENMAISHSSGNLLAIEKRPAPAVNETINLHLGQYRSTNYSFTASVETLVGLKAYVIDNLDGSLTEIIQGGSDTQIDFTVDANNPASIDANRFQIVFETVTLGMGDELASSISMYPNPVTAGHLNVQLNSAASDDLSVIIFNSIGQQISDIQVETTNNNLVQINGLDQFAQGVYFVKVTNDGKEFTSKFIIK
jgi:hypothetical protein